MCKMLRPDPYSLFLNCSFIRERVRKYNIYAKNNTVIDIRRVLKIIALNNAFFKEEEEVKNKPALIDMGIKMI